MKNDFDFLASKFIHGKIHSNIITLLLLQIVQMLENYCGIEENDSSGILLVNDNKLKNTSLAFGKVVSVIYYILGKSVI
mgnify:CR=1 FL=1